MLLLNSNGIVVLYMIDKRLSKEYLAEMDKLDKVLGIQSPPTYTSDGDADKKNSSYQTKASDYSFADTVLPFLKRAGETLWLGGMHVVYAWGDVFAGGGKQSKRLHQAHEAYAAADRKATSVFMEYDKIKRRDQDRSILDFCAKAFKQNGRTESPSEVIDHIPPQKVKIKSMNIHVRNPKDGEATFTPVYHKIKLPKPISKYY